MSPRTIVLVFAVLAVLGAVAWFSFRTEPAKPAKPIEQSRYIPPEATREEVPPMPFTDVTGDSGIAYRHDAGSFVAADGGDSRYLPECMGPGVVLFDPDQDGDQDLFVPNGCAFPGRPTRDPAPTAHYFENRGDFKFVDRSAEVGLALVGYGMGGVAADLDGDGDQDLVVTFWGGARLLRNETGSDGLRFRDVSAEAGLVLPEWTDQEGRRGPEWPTSAALFDADGDRDLDLFLAVYVRWSPETDVFASLDGKRKSFTIPDRYKPSPSRLFLNDGHGRFTDGSEAAGLLAKPGKALGVALCDYDRDGRLDLFVANDSEPNFLFRNGGGGRFEEVGLDAGIAYDENARTRAGMGIDAAEYRNDGVPGIPIGNFANEPVALYRMDSPGFFRDVTQQEGVAAVTQLALTFGVVFADLDRDGLLDLVLANGHLEPHIQDVQAEIPYAQRPQILRNTGRGRFVDAGASGGPAFETPLVARGLGVADLDRDGDLDLRREPARAPPFPQRHEERPPRPARAAARQGPEPGCHRRSGGRQERRPRPAPLGQDGLVLSVAVGADAELRTRDQGYRGCRRRDVAGWSDGIRAAPRLPGRCFRDQRALSPGRRPRLSGVAPSGRSRSARPRGRSARARPRPAPGSSVRRASGAGGRCVRPPA